MLFPCEAEGDILAAQIGIGKIGIQAGRGDLQLAHGLVELIEQRRVILARDEEKGLKRDEGNDFHAFAEERAVGIGVEFLPVKGLDDFLLGGIFQLVEGYVMLLRKAIQHDAAIGPLDGAYAHPVEFFEIHVIDGSIFQRMERHRFISGGKAAVIIVPRAGRKVGNPAGKIYGAVRKQAGNVLEIDMHPLIAPAGILGKGLQQGGGIARHDIILLLENAGYVEPAHAHEPALKFMQGQLLGGKGAFQRRGRQRAVGRQRGRVAGIGGNGGCAKQQESKNKSGFQHQLLQRWPGLHW